MLRNLNRATAGRRILGTPYVGLTAAEISAQTATGTSGPGLLYDEALEYPDARLRIQITDYTGNPDVLFVWEDGSFTLKGEADGLFQIDYDWSAFAADGSAIHGSDFARVQIGAVNGDAPAGEGVSTGSGIGGEASVTGPGSDAGVAPAGEGESAGSGTGGEASATGAGIADAGEGVSTGSGAGGEASTTGSGIAPGGEGTSLGSGSGGEASAMGNGETGNGEAEAGIGTSDGAGYGGAAWGEIIVGGIAFSLSLFYLRFPEFKRSPLAQVTTDEQVIDAFGRAVCWLKIPSCSAGCQDEPYYLMAAHFLYLSYAATKGGTQFGAANNASIGSVSVGMSVPAVKTAWQGWLAGTPYGQQLWAWLALKAAGAWSIGGLPEREGFRKVGGVFW